MRLKDIKIAYRLALGFSLMLVLMAGITTIAERASKQARNSLSETVNRSNSKSALAALMRQTLIRQGLIARHIGMSNDIEEMQKEMARVAVEQKNYHDNEIKLIAMGLSRGELAIVAEMQQHSTAIQPFMRQAEELVAAFNAGQAVKILTTQAAPIQEEWLNAIDRLLDQQNVQIGHNLAQFEAASDQATLLMLTIFGVSMVLAIAIGALVTRSIAGSVTQLMVFSKRVGDGDFSARTSQGGEHEFALLGRAMNQMAESIQNSHVLLESSAVELKHQATHDALTGLPNRALLEDRLQQAMLYAQRYDRLVTLAFIDLDNFKFINDSLGHNAGDELLKTVAGRMLQCVRSTDTVVRLGGDEFVIILFDQPKQSETITALLQKIRESVAQTVHLGGHDFQITCSVGLVTYPGDGEDAQTLLKNADTAMYRAKELGRNNYQFFASEMNARIQEKNWLQEGLLNAIARQQFQLLYQPQVDLRTSCIIGVEALIRWQHPELGMISPARFIPQAEESGLIVAIGDWVLHTACQQNKAWQQAGLPPISMSVNVSARQFMEKDLINRVAQALQDSGLDARYLELELTESVIMRDTEQAIATMHKLQVMGVQLSIDDFGTGYSSLSALKHFPVGRLKIDQSFMRDIPADEDDQAIAMAIIALGHQLKLKVIAEGVETEEQLAFLRDNDCDEMQGYYFSRPVTAGEIEKLFQTPEQLGHQLKRPLPESVRLHPSRRQVERT
ncbi:MAG: EAL domain-containing protein [Rhodoferax sp.]